MGDNDGSSRAAQRALGIEDDDPSGSGLWGRVRDWVTPKAPPGDEATSPPSEAPLAGGDGLINLRRMRVDDVAIPTADIVAVAQTITRDELVAVFAQSGFSRIPVYDGTLDTPLGFVHLKDFALSHGFNGADTAFDMSQMLRSLLFVPPSMTIGVLLAKMQAERCHMALVIDEYGGVDGLLTIEDLIEQVVGEIEDEHDSDEDQTWLREKPGVYAALAKTPLDEFEAELGRSLSDHEDIDAEEIDSLGGLVFMLSGKVPARGEVVLHPDGTEFEVIDADARRIKRLRVRLSDTKG